MKNKTFKIRPISLAFLLAGIGMAPASYAADLVAIEGQWSPDGGTTQIPMWGFASDTGQVCGSLPTWSVGPQLGDADLDAGNLTINLRNCLSDAVSIVIPGQPATFTPVRSGNRITAFTMEAAANGGIASYTWSGVKDGTYLYQSGSHPAKQVQMGLYGALTIKGTSYPDVHDEVTLLYSEIDPVLHSPPTAATPLGYHPRHYLVNGSVSQSFANAGDTNHPTLLRMLNAGLDFHVPTLSSGYMTLVAEDGNAYPFTKQQYSANLAAGKTIDALWQASTEGDYVIYDRRGNNMVASLTVAAGLGQPIAIDDAYPVAEDGTLNVAATGVLVNDTDASGALLPAATASLASSTSSGSVTLLADGSFVYTPNADFNGTDTFTYRANDGTLDSNVASVSITVTPDNDVPVANAGGPYTATVNVPVSLDGSGSSDIDAGDNLTYVWSFGDGNVGTGVMPGHTYTVTGSYPVSLTVNDGTVDSLVAATTVNVGVAVNTAPGAVEDNATVQRNSLPTFINLTDNDTDVDGNLKTLGVVDSTQITVTTGTRSTRGGTVAVVSNGVNYTPKRNFRGTDTFNYTVKDLDGAESNVVTVRVNVVR